MQTNAKQACMTATTMQHAPTRLEALHVHATQGSVEMEQTAQMSMNARQPLTIVTTMQHAPTLLEASPALATQVIPEMEQIAQISMNVHQALIIVMATQHAPTLMEASPALATQDIPEMEQTAPVWICVYWNRWSFLIYVNTLFVLFILMNCCVHCANWDCLLLLLVDFLVVAVIVCRHIFSSLFSVVAAQPILLDSSDTSLLFGWQPLDRQYSYEVCCLLFVLSFIFGIASVLNLFCKLSLFDCFFEWFVANEFCLQPLSLLYQSCSWETLAVVLQRMCWPIAELFTNVLWFFVSLNNTRLTLFISLKHEANGNVKRWSLSVWISQGPLYRTFGCLEGSSVLFCALGLHLPENSEQVTVTIPPIQLKSYYCGIAFLLTATFL